MILSLLILLPLCVLTVWWFLRSVPRSAPAATVRVYNGIIFGVALLLSALPAWWLHGRLEGTADAGWWPVLSVLASFLVFPLVLAVGVLIRNLSLLR
jgi:hypothetical protein